MNWLICQRQVFNDRGSSQIQRPTFIRFNYLGKNRGIMWYDTEVDRINQFFGNIYKWTINTFQKLMEIGKEKIIRFCKFLRISFWGFLLWISGYYLWFPAIPTKFRENLDEKSQINLFLANFNNILQKSPNFSIV